LSTLSDPDSPLIENLIANISLQLKPKIIIFNNNVGNLKIVNSLSYVTNGDLYLIDKYPQLLFSENEDFIRITEKQANILIPNLSNFKELLNKNNLNENNRISFRTTIQFNKLFKNCQLDDLMVR
jgi:hypothetical protein